MKTRILFLFIIGLAFFILSGCEETAVVEIQNTYGRIVQIDEVRYSENGIDWGENLLDSSILPDTTRSVTVPSGTVHLRAVSIDYASWIMTEEIPNGQTWTWPLTENNQVP